MRKRAFGKTSEGRDVALFTLANANGAEIEITNYGGIVVPLKDPYRLGKLADVVLGYQDLASYEKDQWHFAAAESGILQRQFSGRRRAGQGRGGVRQTHRIVPADAAFSGLSLDSPEVRRELRVHNGLHILELVAEMERERICA